MLRIQDWPDFNRLTEVIGEKVEVLYDDHKGELSRRGYHDAGPGSIPQYRVMRKDMGHVNATQMNTDFIYWDSRGDHYARGSA